MPDDDRPHLSDIQRFGCHLMYVAPPVVMVMVLVGITGDAVTGDWGGVVGGGVIFLILWWAIMPIAAEARRALDDDNPKRPPA
jgi:hypothetical protein